ncbi:MAG: hypothetical protein Q8O88_05855 [bacterium]|nr:hypothetical protein [bacterium]
MRDYIDCDICGRLWTGENGDRMVSVRLDGSVRFIFVCPDCGEGKSDFDIFKIVYPVKFGGEGRE